jgi:hypothetical protein
VFSRWNDSSRPRPVLTKPVRRNWYQRVRTLSRSCDDCTSTLTLVLAVCSIAWDIGAVGTCGQIQPCNDIRLEDVPDMGYTSKDVPNPRGE